ncbi:MAG: Ureidoglycolate dehydrogenase [Rhodopila sp.]|nr:Ureidoglycolate dehydrogenase [Rhodopila sp.]
MPKSRRVNHVDLTHFARAVFESAGVAPDNAEIWAETLIWANLRGVDSHGVLRIPRYVELLGSGDINPTPDLRILRSAGAIALLDADRAPGPVAMRRAMDEAIAHARDVHVGWCVARGITHAGAVGHFALRAAASGMIGVVMTASVPLMAYHGSRGSVVSTNPIAIAVPAERRPPLLLDMATATVALGKITQARNSGSAIPPGWGVDRDGIATTDPHQVATLLPMAGMKGSGLSLMIECIASLTAANPVIAPALAGRTGTNMNGVAIALDVSAFGDRSTFLNDVDALGDAVARQPTAPGHQRLLLPAERGNAVRMEREQTGIPLPPGTWSGLAAVAAARGIAMPTPRS